MVIMFMVHINRFNFYTSIVTAAVQRVIGSIVCIRRCRVNIRNRQMGLCRRSAE